MNTVRRGYVYLASFVSLQAVAWAIISLLRNLIARGEYTSRGSLALNIATIVIGLPIFLVHWLWAQRLAARDAEEREAVLRRFYLYGAMTSFLGAIIPNAFDLIDTLLQLLFGVGSTSAYRYRALSRGDLIVHHIVAMVVMALLWFYQRRILAADVKATPETGRSATVRRLYSYGFSAAGLTMASLGIIALLRWLMYQFGGGVIITSHTDLTREVARLVVGLALWIAFWSWSQRLYAGKDREEHASVPRKLYLYAAVFISVLASVTAATYVLAGAFRRLLGVSSRGGDGDIREALAIIIAMSLVWAYHAMVLRRDAAATEERPRQARIRQVYFYLVAAVGLGAFLIGLGGDISALIRYLSSVRAASVIPEEVAWFSAVIVAGLPVWILPWRRVQIASTAPGADGDQESRSIVRKIYLYLFLFAATMTMLGSGVYIVFRLVSLALGEGGAGNLLTDIGQAVAFSLIATGVWLYHGSILRVDGRRVQEVQAERLATLRVAVLDVGDGSLGLALSDELRRALPGLNLQPLGLTPEACAALSSCDESPDLVAALAESDVIIGPWLITVAGAADGAVDAEISNAVTTSPARKLLIPSEDDDWAWIGVGHMRTKDIVRQAVRAVKEITAQATASQSAH